ncbi:hypothetical protein ACS0TY_035380 [Phlomoides rotata]
MDAKVVTYAINDTRVADTVFYDFIRSCKSELVNFSSISVDFVQWVANEKAHRLARVVRTFLCPQCWIEP